MPVRPRLLRTGLAMTRPLRLFPWLLLLWGCASAHTLNMTRVLVTLGPDQALEVKVDVDLTPLLGRPEDYGALLRTTGEEQVRAVGRQAEQLLGNIEFAADGRRLALSLSTWQFPDVPPEKIGDNNVAVMTTLLFTGTLPVGAQAFTISSPMSARIEFPVAYTFSVPAENRTQTRWLDLPGAKSRAFALASAGPGAAVAIPAAIPFNPAVQPAASVPASNPVAPAAAKPTDVSPTALAVAVRLETAGQFLWLGFLHILPRGADHILFVIGLFFLGLKWRPLLTQTTAFTIAHTTTLGLSAYGIVSLPARVVEPLIALSIAYVAIENMVRPKLTAVRVAVVFLFGLLHGLGFASSLSEVPMPRDQFFTALLAFNFGVDFGQLAVIALAFLAVGWWRHRPWYRFRVVIPACTSIACVSLFWTVQRTFF